MSENPVKRDTELDDRVEIAGTEVSAGDVAAGAALGGVGGIAAGAVLGAAGGPVGVAVGAVIGAMAGSAAGGTMGAAVNSGPPLTGDGHGTDVDTDVSVVDVVTKKTTP